MVPEGGRYATSDVQARGEAAIGQISVIGGTRVSGGEIPHLFGGGGGRPGGGAICCSVCAGWAGFQKSGLDAGAAASI
jgi:hypothetical protein